MEFPFGHKYNHSHTHHHRNDDLENPERPPPPHLDQQHEFAPPPPHYQQPGFDRPAAPPSSYFPQPGFAAAPPYQPPPYHQQQTEFPAPTSHVTHFNVHSSGGSHLPDHASFNYTPAPAHVPHVTHESGQERIDHHQSEGHHSFRPHVASFDHQSHSGSASDTSKKPTVKVYCKADPSFHLTIREGKVILAPSDPSDQYQHWYKDEKFSTRVKDKEGFPSFSLVNKVTGQAIQHSTGASHPVQLIPYKSDHLDLSILWTESKIMADGYRAVRMVNDISLNVDAFHGDKSSGGVQNGITIVLWQWNNGDNQLWKIVPYCKILKKLSHNK